MNKNLKYILIAALILLALWTFVTHSNNCRKHPEEPGCQEAIVYDQ